MRSSSASRCFSSNTWNRPVGQVVRARVQQLAVVAGHRVGPQRRGQGVVLQLDRELGQRAVGTLVAGHELERPVDAGPERRRHRHPLERQRRLEPFRRPGAFAGRVDAGKRLEPQRIGPRGREVVVRRPRSLRERPHRVADVEHEYLGARVTAELGRDERQEHRFPRARLAEHQGVADV